MLNIVECKNARVTGIIVKKTFLLKMLNRMDEDFCKNIDHSLCTITVSNNVLLM